MNRKDGKLLSQELQYIPRGIPLKTTKDNVWFLYRCAPNTLLLTVSFFIYVVERLRPNISQLALIIDFHMIYSQSCRIWLMLPSGSRIVCMRQDRIPGLAL